MADRLVVEAADADADLLLELQLSQRSKWADVGGLLVSSWADAGGLSALRLLVVGHRLGRG